jgi:rhodanese-related sulfurtransferase
LSLTPFCIFTGGRNQTAEAKKFGESFYLAPCSSPVEEIAMTEAVTNLIGVEEWKAWQAEGRPAQLVDVRSAAEFATGHLPCAINIPLEQLEARAADLSHCAPLVLVCQGGTRATLASARLAAQGRESLVLKGGTTAWLKAGYPAVRSTAARWALERQVRLVAGLLVAVGVLLGATLSPWWLLLPALVGCGLSFAGFTGFCPMGELLARMPWNRPRRIAPNLEALPPGSCACAWRPQEK